MKEQQETRYSLDSGCDSTSEKVKITIKEEEPLMFLTTKNDNESVYSANSAATTITTSSTYRKKPSTMFSSVKQFISSSKKSIYPEQEPSRLKRHTPSTISFGSLFSRNKQQLENEASTGSSLFSLSPPNQPATFGYSSSSDDTNRASAWHRSKRRNSVVDLASRFLSNKKDDYKLDSQEEEEEEEDDEEESIFKFETHAGHSQLEIQVHQEEDSVGTLLFGKDVDHLEFLQHEATKSESLLSTKHEHLQQRQRAKSCLEESSKAPMLHHLASHDNSVAGLPLFKGLMTATLDSLHQRLLNECEETLNHIVKTNDPVFPTDPLQCIMFDLRKLTDMIKYDDEYQKKSLVEVEAIEKMVQQGNETNGHLQEIIILVKEIISKVKNVIHLCVSQYYKMAEMAMSIPSKGYKIEGHNSYGTLYHLDFFHEEDNNNDDVDPTTLVDHKDNQAHWFKSYFLDRDVFTFFGYIADDEPVLISAVTEINENGNKQYRIICRSKKDNKRRLIKDSFLLNPPRKDTNDDVDDAMWKNIIETSLNIPFHQLKYMPNDILKSSGMDRDILRLDESALCSHHKFGVLLVKEGQTREEEWFSNQHDSEPFNDFLDIIGKRVELKGYTGWTGGLDTRSGDSGEYTFVNVWNQVPLAYHVATLIPSKSGDKQQIQRKRHIGNDIVCIVFVEGRQPFNPAAIKSQFLHVFIIVHQEKWKDQDIWRVEVVRVQEVPEFGPPLPEIAIFDSKEKLSHFLLAKLVNAEYAALKSLKFSMPMARAREGIINSIIERGGSKILVRHSKSPSSSSSTISSKSLKYQRSTNTIDHGYSGKNDNLKKTNTNNTNDNNNNDKRGFSRRSQSEFDVAGLDLKSNSNSFRVRAQSILTSIPGFTRSSVNQDESI